MSWTRTARVWTACWCRCRVTRTETTVPRMPMARCVACTPLDTVCYLAGIMRGTQSCVCVCRCAYQVVAGSLFPGVYFVRPMLKEYSFAPSAADITVDEGGSVSVTFTATRVAYSAFGRVVALNGLPVAGVFVEASAVGVASEQATADKQGYYRIRGLVPGLAYTISAHNVSTFTVSPASHAITVSEQSGVGWMCVVWMPAFATATS